MCRSFPTTLKRVARVWFSKLAISLITNFEQLGDSFVRHFIGGQRHKRLTSHLLTIKQQEGETLRAYVKCFTQAILEIDEADDQVQLTAFQASLMTKNFIFLLAKTPATSMISLLFKAQKYMNEEDALTAKGIDGKQKMEEIDEP